MAYKLAFASSTFTDNLALTALGSTTISSSAYTTLSNIPEYGKMLTAFCVFYHSLLTNENRQLLDDYIARELDLFNLKYKMLLLICKHAPTEGHFEQYLDPLEPMLTMLKLSKTDGIDRIKLVLNGNFDTVLALLQNQRASLENIMNNGFNTIRGRLGIKGGKSKKNKRKSRRTRRLRKY
jgi:hypothetical protein